MQSFLKSIFILIATIRLCVCGYNLIDEYPSCMNKGYCPYAKPWNLNSIHPNQEERSIMVMRNIARLQPTAYKNSIYNRKFGHYGPKIEYYCDAKPQSHPFYWLSEANQVTRFHQWAGAHCPSKQVKHSTCPEYCDLFPSAPQASSQCGYVTRSAAFLEDTGAGVGGEGLWGGNMGYFSGHCGLVFDPKYDYIGVGYWPGANGVTNLGVILDPPSFPIPQGSHYDERTKTHKDSFRNDGKNLAMMVEYYGKPNGNRKAKKVYVLYDGAFQELSLAFGSSKSGFYKGNFLVPTQCKPYAFVVVDQSDNIFRLPQDDKFFFGTSWTVTSMGNNGRHYKAEYTCDENHYYYKSNSWRKNAGPKAYGDGGNCKGCDEAKQLATKYKEFIGNGNPDQVIDNDPGGSGGDESSCVYISRLYRLNGEYEDDGSVWNKKTVYYNEIRNLYLYNVFDSDSNADVWTISDRKGKESLDKGWCKQNDILSCNGKWDLGINGIDSNCEFRSCSNNGRFSVYDECTKDYNDKLCVYGNTNNDTLWDGDTAQFQIYTDECSHDQLVYRYNTYFLHYYNNGTLGQWIISEGITGFYGKATCYKEDLMDCIEGEWVIQEMKVLEWETDVGNYTVYDAEIEFEHFVDYKMGIYNAACGYKDERDYKLRVVSIVVAIVLFVLIAILCGIMWWKIKNKNKLQKYKIGDESDEEIEIETTTQV